MRVSARRRGWSFCLDCMLEVNPNGIAYISPAFPNLLSVSPDGRRRKKRKQQDTRYKQIPNLKLQISNKPHRLSEVTSRFRAAPASVLRISPQRVGRLFVE